jgi:hypothetical protein
MCVTGCQGQKDFMVTVQDIHQSWQEKSDALEVQKDALNDTRAPLAARSAAFKAQKPAGLWGKLTYAFTKATKIASVDRKVRKLDTQIAGKDFELRQAAADTYRQLGEFGLTKMQDGETLLGHYMDLHITRAKTDTALRAVTTAINQSKEASDYELFDMASNNAGISLVSYLETDEAAAHIKAAGAALTDLNKQLRTAEKLDPTISAALQSDNNLDLFVDMVSDFAGIFTSYSNMKKLDEAVSKMIPVQASLQELGDEVNKSLRHIQTVAIQAVQKQHPDMVAAVQSLQAHLPAETVAELQAPPRRFKL